MSNQLLTKKSTKIENTTEVSPQKTAPPVFIRDAVSRGHGALYIKATIATKAGRDQGSFRNNGGRFAHNREATIILSASKLNTLAKKKVRHLSCSWNEKILNPPPHYVSSLAPFRIAWKMASCRFRPLFWLAPGLNDCSLCKLKQQSNMTVDRSLCFIPI